MTYRRAWERAWLGLLLLTGCEGAAGERSDAIIAATALGDGGCVPPADVGLPEGGQDAGSLYPRVVAIIERSCAYQRCHAGTPVGAGLSFEVGGDHRAMLVGVRACEYDRMARVTPGDPDQSWLWVKLTAPFRPLDDPYAHSIYFTPPHAWDETARGCRDQTDEGLPLFGQRMPSTAPNTLSGPELEVIRRWILAGAPP